MTLLPHESSWFMRRGLAIVLAAGFLMMSALVVEQGKVIQDQRDMIRILFADSVQLTAMRIQQLHHRR
jgi:hypothetical protein